MTSRWLCAAAISLAATGCTSLCDGDTVETQRLAGSSNYGKGIAACLERRDCAALCAALFDVPATIDRCEIVSLVWPDDRIQPISAAAHVSIDIAGLRGVNVRATFTEQVACETDDDGDAWDWDWDWDWDDGDDGGDDGGYDDGGCSDCDDGGDDGADDGGDSGGDDSGGDDDGGDDDGGTYGDPLRAPTEAPRG